MQVSPLAPLAMQAQSPGRAMQPVAASVQSPARGETDEMCAPESPSVASTACIPDLDRVWSEEESSDDEAQLSGSSVRSSQVFLFYY